MSTTTRRCQYTGLELPSPRMKNHPRVTRLLTQAADNGTYRAVVTALEQARDAGLDADAILTAGQAAYAGQTIRNEQAQQQQAAAAHAAEQARRSAQRRRDAINSALSRAGYHWRREDEESMDRYAASAFQREFGERDAVWLLISPTGERVTVATALTTLGRADLLEVAQ